MKVRYQLIQSNYKDRTKSRIQNPHLNPDWTFDNFVLGKANQLARAAAQQICDNPGHGYNPFFFTVVLA